MTIVIVDVCVHLCRTKGFPNFSLVGPYLKFLFEENVNLFVNKVLVTL